MQWSVWMKFPTPTEIRRINVLNLCGVYQLRNRRTDEFVLFGIAGRLRVRMKSLMPAPYGTGTRKNESKRKYVLENHHNLEFRVCYTPTKEKAREIENELKKMCRHIFNT